MTNPPLNERERVLVWALQVALSFIPSFKRHRDPLLRQVVGVLTEIEDDFRQEVEGTSEAMSKEPLDGEEQLLDIMENVVSLRDYMRARRGHFRQGVGDDRNGDGGNTYPPER